MPRSINNLLTDWGRKQRQSPLRNDSLKSEILSKLPPALSLAPSPRGLPWLSLSLASLAMIIFIVQSASVDDVIIRRGTTGVAVPEKTSIAPEYFPQPRPDTPISDSREFLKRSYNAAVR
ncbi:MAG: hypothetical protein AAB642_02010, partial [Patescibacteria group bacterium]